MWDIVYNNSPFPYEVTFVLVALVQILILMLPLMGAVAYYTLAERKVIGFMQLRIGPNRVGFFGLGQPLADAFKLMFKEIVIPSNSNAFLFVIAPILSLGPALAAWAVIPFADGWVVSDINAGLLYILAMTSIGVYGVIIAGWASNSKYPLVINKCSHKRRRVNSSGSL